jgi:stearoyl-CoA desaturase (delta-9 desaturase)
MAFINRVLKTPRYGWEDENGEFIIPSTKTLFAEAFHNVNIFNGKKHWLPFFSWGIILALVPFMLVFGFEYASLKLMPIVIVYGLIVTSVHGTIWFHRYCTHKAYTFSHPIWRLITQNLVIKTVPEEIYSISHHVHHVISDLPGDPYNARGGFLYCMLADVNHQSISRELDSNDYKKVSAYLRHTGVKINTYAQYKKWGSVTNPFYAVISHLLNWAFWYGTFFLIGGHGLATGMFSAALFWFVLVRAFNYTGHGNGEEKHVDGIDYDRTNLSINQLRPGLFSGEWHNNHHLYPKSARAGFLPYQLDLAWVYIYILSKIGGVSSYIDQKSEFLEKHVHEHREKELH